MHLDMNAVVSCIQFSNDSVDLVEASLDIKSNIFMEFLQVCLSVFVCNDIIMTNFDILKQAALMTATSHGRRGMIHTSRKQQPQRLTVTIDPVLCEDDFVCIGFHVKLTSVRSVVIVSIGTANACGSMSWC